jgi:uncharacterized protein DUF5708
MPLPVSMRTPCTDADAVSYWPKYVHRIVPEHGARYPYARLASLWTGERHRAAGGRDRGEDVTKTRRELLIGAATAGVGGALKLFADDVDTPVIALGKIGLVLVIVGVAEVLYALYSMARDRTA